MTAALHDKNVQVKTLQPQDPKQDSVVGYQFNSMCLAPTCCCNMDLIFGCFNLRNSRPKPLDHIFCSKR